MPEQRSALEAFLDVLQGADPQERAEWLDALETVIGHIGPERAFEAVRKALADDRLEPAARVTDAVRQYCSDPDRPSPRRPEPDA